MLQLLPVAAFLAAGIAPQAWADSGGDTSSGRGSDYYVGNNGTGSDNAVIVDSDFTNRPPDATGAAGTWSYAIGGYDVGTASGNTLTIDSTGEVYGAFGGYGGDSAPDSKADNNTLTIRGTVSSGGDAIGGFCDQCAATNNKVFVEQNSVVAGSVYGGFVGHSGNIANTQPVATGNTVTISGGTVSGDVYGGFCADNPQNPGAGDKACNGADEWTGNTLDVQAGSLPLPLPAVDGGIQNFAKLDFMLPASAKAGDIVLTANDATFPAATTPVSLAFNGTPTFKVDDEIILLNTLQGLTITLEDSVTKALSAGGYSFVLRNESNKQLIAKVVGVPPDPTPVPVPAPAGGCGADTLDPGDCQGGSTGSSSAPATGGIGLLLAGAALAGAAAPALRRRERKNKV